MMKNPENDYIPSRGRRKRSRDRNDLADKVIFARFNAAEFDTVDRACDIEHRSLSSFAVDATLTRAEEILRIYKRAVSEREK
jgi:uncharacterized protein (DUF1778 family)